MKQMSTGLTLVEVLVSIAILAVVSASVAGVLATIANFNRVAVVEQAQTVAVKDYFESAQRVVSQGGLVDASTPSVPAGCSFAGNDPFPAAAAPALARRLSLNCDVVGAVSLIVALGGAP